LDPLAALALMFVSPVKLALFVWIVIPVRPPIRFRFSRYCMCTRLANPASFMMETETIFEHAT